MPTAFTVECNLPIPAHILWRVRVSPTFMSHLVNTGALTRMDASASTPLSGQSSLYSRIQTYVPSQADIPDVVKGMLDDSILEVTDTQTWDENKPGRQSFSIHPTPPVLADLVKTSGELVVEDAKEGDAGSCRHVLSGRCEVSVPMLGWYLEQTIVSNMRKFYAEYPHHIAAFVDTVVNRWGNGRKESLACAVDKMLAEEKDAKRKSQQSA
eukprot:GFKZ01006686.1.p1 GENE.GFKZ01006686.1~~GFKZ01006686.1.p1  ORF type:complete len:211 (-),score=28.18 GFKZ01006686.1:669-1301(-)